MGIWQAGHLQSIVNDFRPSVAGVLFLFGQFVEKE
jgi:hypothetical protein